MRRDSGSALILVPDALGEILGTEPRILLTPVRNALVALPDELDIDLALAVWGAFADGLPMKLDVEPMHWTGSTVAMLDYDPVDRRSFTDRRARRAARWTGRAAIGARSRGPVARGDEGPEPRPVSEHAKVRELVDHDRLERLRPARGSVATRRRADCAARLCPSASVVPDVTAPGGTLSAPACCAIARSISSARPRLSQASRMAADRPSIPGAQLDDELVLVSPPTRSTLERRTPDPVADDPESMQVARNRTLAPSRPPRAAMLGPVSSPADRGGDGAMAHAPEECVHPRLGIAPTRDGRRPAP